jgi:hypothetical protein
MLKIVSLLVALMLQIGVVHAGAYEEILADAEHDRTGAVLELLQLGLDVNTATPDGTTLLMTASRNGNLDLVDSLLKKHANHLVRNSFGDTALMLAAFAGQLAVVERLLELGGQQEHRDGWTALHYAAIGGRVDVARFLVAKGAKVDARAPNTQTALMLAAAAGNLDMVKFLIDEQADIKLKDHNGKTAMDVAEGKGNKQVAGYIAAFYASDK